MQATETGTVRYSDDVRRVADEMDLHAVAGSSGWAVFALADGRPADHTPYESWTAAVKSTKWDRDNFMYLEIRPDGMPLREAEAVLRYARFIHSQGWRIPSPDAEQFAQATQMPYQPRDRRVMAKQLISGRPLYPDDVPYTNLPSAFRRKQ